MRVLESMRSHYQARACPIKEGAMLPIPLDAKVLKSQVAIEEVAGRYTRLKRRGRQYVSLYPFHSERHASFYVDPAKAVFYCFGCGAGGDVFTLVMRAEGIDFRTALKVVAGVASESEGCAAIAAQSPKRFRAGEGAAPQPAQPAAYIASAPQEPKARPVGELPALAVECAAECAALLLVNKRITGTGHRPGSHAPESPHGKT